MRVSFIQTRRDRDDDVIAAVIALLPTAKDEYSDLSHSSLNPGVLFRPNRYLRPIHQHACLMNYSWLRRAKYRYSEAFWRTYPTVIK